MQGRVEDGGVSVEGAEVPQPLEPAHVELHHPVFREATQQLVPIGLGAPNTEYCRRLR